MNIRQKTPKKRQICNPTSSSNPNILTVTPNPRFPWNDDLLECLMTSALRPSILRGSTRRVWGRVEGTFRWGSCRTLSWGPWRALSRGSWRWGWTFSRGSCWWGWCRWVSTEFHVVCVISGRLPVQRCTSRCSTRYATKPCKGISCNRLVVAKASRGCESAESGTGTEAKCISLKSATVIFL